MTWISAKYLGGPAHDTIYNGPCEAVTILAWRKPQIVEWSSPPLSMAEHIAHRPSRHTYRLHEWREVRYLGRHPYSTFTYWYEGPWGASVIAAFLYARAIEGNLPRPITREISQEALDRASQHPYTGYPSGSRAEQYLAKVRAAEELATGLTPPDDLSRFAHPQQGDAWLRRAAAHLADHPDYQEEWRP